MRRIIVLGGLGLFGRTAADELRELGHSAQVASRRGDSALHVDANGPESIRSALRAGDIVIDAAGPFHLRTTALVEAATAIGFDVIDINDDLEYAERVLAIAPRIESAGIRVLTSASSVSAVSAAVVRRSGVHDPKRVAAFLAPASRHTANPGAALSLIRSVGRPVQVFRDGEFRQAIGWSDPRVFTMPPPLGLVRGRLFESADAVHLPRVWPTLRDVSMYVDTNTPGVNLLLRLAARVGTARRLMERGAAFGTRVARMFGSSVGGIGYEIEDGSGQTVRYAIVADKNSFVTAVAPAVLAAQRIAEDRFPDRGLIAPDRHVEPDTLFEFLNSRGIGLLGPY